MLGEFWLHSFGFAMGLRPGFSEGFQTQPWHLACSEWGEKVYGERLGLQFGVSDSSEFEQSGEVL